MELQTRFLYLKLQNGEDLITLGVFPSDPTNIKPHKFNDLIFALFPAKVTYKPKSYFLSDWCPLSKASLFKIPMFSVISANAPIDEAADEYAMYLMEKRIGIEKIKDVLSEEFEAEEDRRIVTPSSKPTLLH